MSRKGNGMAVAKPRSLVDDVLSRTRRVRPGFKSWFERLPAAAQTELKAVRKSFAPDKHQKKSFAVAIMEAAKERGWETGGVQAVLAWLDKND